MKFTESHEWIKVEGEDQGIIGISSHAKNELGEVVYVELPEVGKKVHAGEELCVVESSKAAADIYSPVSGTILEVNSELSANPSMVNVSPEEKGWICKISLSNREELASLLDKEAYENNLV